MSYFPEEILEEIFLRLPRKSLSRFKCLSKLFCALFGSHSFQNMHHELINLKINPSVVLHNQAKNNKIYTIDYKSVSSLLPLSASSPTMCIDCHELAIRTMDYPSIFDDYDKVEFWSSCRGLVWIGTTKGSCEEFYIWNTETEGCEKIRLTPEVNNKKFDGYGLGYDNKMDDYKLIMVAANRDTKCSDVFVYTLGTNSWRRIDSLYYPQYYLEAVEFNGALHWPAHAFGEGPVHDKLVCFHIVDERFEEVALPEALIPYPENMFEMSLNVSEVCLCLVIHVFSVRIDVWMMQKYGVRQSWVKIFTSCLENFTSNDLKFLWHFNNCETLWRDDRNGDLILYDPNKKIRRKLILDSDYAESVTVAEKNYTTSSVLFT